MANVEHLEILAQGVDTWNKWRKQKKRPRADLSWATSVSGNLASIDLGVADLAGIQLIGTNLTRANLIAADLTSANLTESQLMNALLQEANLFEAAFNHTMFGNNDLSNTKGLETAQHFGPSSIGIDTIYRSRGNIPECFLRGCGVPEGLIVQVHDLIGSQSPIQFYSCFISYDAGSTKSS